MKINEWIKSLFRPSTYYQDSVEKYIKLKSPTNPAELELWLRTYEREQLHRKGFLS